MSAPQAPLGSDQPYPQSVAVIVPVYNRAHTIGDAIDSLLAQTAPPDEIIVVDDGSTDDLAAALACYGDRIRTIRQANAGAAAARNTGAATARADWLTFLDSDDCWKPDRLALLRRDLAEHTGTIVAHVANVRLVGHGAPVDFFAVSGIDVPPGTVRLSDRPLRLFLHAFFLVGAAVRRDVFAELGGFDPGFPVDEDSELAHRLAALGPFLLRGDSAGDIVRREGDTNALSQLRRRDPRMANDLKLRQFRAILARAPDPADAALVRSALCHALLQRACLLRDARSRGYWATLWAAARSHPSLAKGLVHAGRAMVRGSANAHAEAADRTHLAPRGPDRTNGSDRKT